MNHSITRSDMSREVREELYDGTARIVVTAADGTVLSDDLVPSDEQAPVEDPAPLDPVVVEDFATAIVGADNMQQMKDAAQALLDALGGA